MQTGTYYQPKTPTHVRETLVCTQMSQILKKGSFYCSDIKILETSSVSIMHFMMEVMLMQQMLIQTDKVPVAGQPAAVEHTSNNGISYPILGCKGTDKTLIKTITFAVHYHTGRAIHHTYCKSNQVC